MRPIRAGELPGPDGHGLPCGWMKRPLLRWVGLESVSGRSSNAEYHFMIETWRRASEPGRSRLDGDRRYLRDSREGLSGAQQSLPRGTHLTIAVGPDSTYRSCLFSELRDVSAGHSSDCRR